MKNVNLKLNRVKDFILDLIFPKECLGCGREGHYLCLPCLREIKLTGEFYCALCKKTSAWGQICASCQKGTKLKAIWVAADYNNKILQDLIHALKYNYIDEISRDLASLGTRYLLEQKIFSEFQLQSANTILVPVPLHRKRFLSRGFNQSELLAKQISLIEGRETVNLLQRIKNTETQINLKRKERQENVKDAFKVTDKNLDINKKVILIDDVVTTGSTLKECAQALADAGFDEIYGLVIAQRED